MTSFVTEQIRRLAMEDALQPSAQSAGTAVQLKGGQRRSDFFPSGLNAVVHVAGRNMTAAGESAQQRVTGQIKTGPSLRASRRRDLSTSQALQICLRAMKQARIEILQSGRTVRVCKSMAP